MTLTEKILHAKAGKKVRFESRWNVVNDENYDTLCAFGPLNAKDEKLVMFVDHIVPAIDENVDKTQTAMRSYAKAHGNAYFEGKGIGYLLLAEKLVNKGEIVCGTGSHIGTVGAAGALGVRQTPEAFANGLKDSCFDTVVPESILVCLTGEKPAGKSVRNAVSRCAEELKKRDLSHVVLEVAGEGLAALSMAERAEVCAVLTAAGAWSVIVNDGEAEQEGYLDTVTVDLGCGDKCILAPAEAVIPEDGVIPVKSAFVGGCTGGSIEDIRLVADVVRGRHVKQFLRFHVCPNTMSCYLQAIQEGLIEDLVESGVMVTNPHCSTCFGKTQGKIAAGENMISTGLCSAAGLCGSKQGHIFLAAPEEVARVALCGYIKKEELYGTEV